MSEETKEVFTCGIIATTVICFVALLVVGTNYSSYKIAEMVKNGADPQSANCALNYGSGHSIVCVELAKNKTKNNP